MRVAKEREWPLSKLRWAGAGLCGIGSDRERGGGRDTGPIGAGRAARHALVAAVAEAQRLPLNGRCAVHNCRPLFCDLLTNGGSIPRVHAHHQLLTQPIPRCLAFGPGACGDGSRSRRPPLLGSACASACAQVTWAAPQTTDCTMLSNGQHTNSPVNQSGGGPGWAEAVGALGLRDARFAAACCAAAARRPVDASLHQLSCRDRASIFSHRHPGSPSEAPASPREVSIDLQACSTAAPLCSGPRPPAAPIPRVHAWLAMGRALQRPHARPAVYRRLRCRRADTCPPP